MKICITGSTGLIGSTAATFFIKQGHVVVGIDNDMRKKFFGKNCSTNKQRSILKKKNNYKHFNIDIRNQAKINYIFKNNKFDAVIHCAAQPSHDKAKDIPLLDFQVNALGTLNILEATRKFNKEAVFIFTSTNKVYGDNPNKIPLTEDKERYRFKDKNISGIDENTSIDHCIHSLMGSSKLAADIYVQEYGINFGMKTTCLRLGCITGISHASTELHGFLSYLVKSLINNQSYKIIGYKGKQVRDQLDAYDLAQAFNEIIKKPGKGEVFNLGGGLKNNASIIELINTIDKKLNIKTYKKFLKKARNGDHICYISDISKFQKHYPKWTITKSINNIVDNIIEYEQNH